ncbi:hypothetical protein BGY98DRAFT_999673 [Russula aff. rugulosa BPL654]|nr:hypothetical protein BGY98DRAFT_999673 [Russula aff. rugulosa BPL654]
MLALQGTLIVVPFHCISSSMDEHALESGHVSPSGSMEWRARAPTPQHLSTQPQLSPQRADLAGTRPSGNLHIRAHPYRPLSAHPARRHHEHRSPAASSSSSRSAQPHAYEHRQDRPQHARIRGSAGSTPRARTSRPPTYLGTTPSQERLGKRKRPASAESSAASPQTVATHRDSVGPQRSHRRHHNVAEKTHSTMLPSGGMFMTFPLDIPSPEPETDGGESAGPPPFEHGPSELPPRPYEQRRTEGDSGPERTVKRGRLPADVMDHLPTIEGRLRRIEDTVKDYLDARNMRALEKSKLPGS